MKTTIIFILLLVEFSFCYSQNNQIDKEYFLLGTLDDYLGRRKNGEIDSTVDRHYPHEKMLTFFLDSLFKTEYPDLRSDTTSSGHRTLYSKKLSSKINHYYTFTESNVRSITEDNREVIVYYGTLKAGIFKKDLSKYSYLAGVFARYGTIKGDTFIIKLANSTNKFKTCEKLLKTLRCENVETETLQTIPRANTITFTSTKKLKPYLLQTKEWMKKRKTILK